MSGEEQLGDGDSLCMSHRQNFERYTLIFFGIVSSSFRTLDFQIRSSSSSLVRRDFHAVLILRLARHSLEQVGARLHFATMDLPASNN